ncbi:hypothetical protein [Spiroplasma endosymbiont of Aspidapion aeneum]|uniref:hypothetical protein n=1 Tax=Spiroplasma endosymbiont of Aspidapion aeneum TaxID=3066276 RepID=UPI00313CCDEC
MSTYTITVNNRLYQVVDINTERIIATFISENDAQTFIQTLYAKMFQEQKEIISNKLFLSQKGEDFINRAILGTKNFDNKDEDFDEDFENDQDLNSGEDFDEDFESSDSSTTNYFDDVIPESDFESGKWDSKTLDSKPVDDDFMELTMKKFSSPKPEYWNIIEKPSLINNYDDNSLGEAASYDKFDGKTELVKDLTFTKEIGSISNNYQKKIEETSESIYLDKIQEEGINSFNNSEMVTVVAPSTDPNKPKFILDNATIDSSESNSVDLSNIYKDFLDKDGKSDNNDESNNTSEVTKSFLSEQNIVQTQDRGDVIDLGPIKEEDDIFSTPRADAIEDADIEKAILSGKLKILSPKEQKKEDKRLRKEQKKGKKI